MSHGGVPKSKSTADVTVGVGGGDSRGDGKDAQVHDTPAELIADEEKEVCRQRPADTGKHENNSAVDLLHFEGGRMR